MWKLIKFILSLIGILIFLIIIDFVFIFTFNRPVFGVQAKQPYTYTGIFYNVYNCPEYPMAQIKSKKTKFNCAISRKELGKVINIVDTTKEIDNFSCAEALEIFYEDEKYQYFWNCIKGNYMIVKYESGLEEIVAKALKYETISISDLDYYDVDYIKQEKINK